MRGAWIEIVTSALHCSVSVAMSLPVRGAWIEIVKLHPRSPLTLGRSPCGERGLKYCYRLCLCCLCHRRSPCGERGLK